jgi:sigma-B regulation protein RsbU (phosphoserine phosphatase)
LPGKLNRITEKTKVLEFKLRALLDLTHAINANRAIGELLDLYKTVMNKELGIDKLVLFQKSESNWIPLFQFGIDGVPEPIKDETFFHGGQSTALANSAVGNNDAFDIVIPVYHNDIPIAYVLTGDLEEDQLGMSRAVKHMNFVQTFTNVMLVAIRNKKLAEENLRQEILRKELELAAEMQAILVPHELPVTNTFEISAVYRPHQQVGGDYYDFAFLNEDEFMFCVADVSGKGVSAAFLMANFQAYLRAIFQYLQLPLEEAVKELNQRVMRSAMGEKFITFFVATYNTSTRMLQYVNCGHNPPVLVNKNDEVRFLSQGSIGLGILESIKNVSKGTMLVEPGSTLVCYTDGLVELENEDNQEYGTDRLINVITTGSYGSMDELNRQIMEDINTYKGSMPYVDDIALLTCRFF